MKKKPVISVIIVNYNGLSHIDTCLNSVLHQSYTDYEVIFVDNASGDESLEYAKSKYPDIKFVVNDKNLGYVGGINSAIQYAEGSYLAPLNLDTEVDINWLSVMVEFMQNNPDAGAVTPKILFFTKRDRINTMGLDIHVSGLAFCKNIGKQSERFNSIEIVSGISGCSYMVRKEIFSLTGGLPEECFMANDDVILSWLINLMGYNMYCIPESVVYHKYHPNLNPRKIYNLEKNRLMLLLYSLKKSTLILLSPVYAIMELIIFGYCLIKGPSFLKAKIMVYSELYKDRDLIRARKKQFSVIRKINDRKLLSKMRWKLNLSALNFT